MDGIMYLLDMAGKALAQTSALLSDAEQRASTAEARIVELEAARSESPPVTT